MLKFAWNHKWFPIKAIAFMLAVNTAGTMLWLVSPKIENKTDVNVRPFLEKTLAVEGAVFNGAYDVTSDLFSTSWTWQNLVLAGLGAAVVGRTVWRWRGKHLVRAMDDGEAIRNTITNLARYMPSAVCYNSHPRVVETLRVFDKACEAKLKEQKRITLRDEDKRFKKRCETIKGLLDQALIVQTSWDNVSRGKVQHALTSVLDTQEL